MSRVQVVLEQDWHPVQKASRSLGFAFFVERTCDRQRLGVDLDDRVERRPASIDMCDALEVLFRERGRGFLAGLHRRFEVGDSRFLQYDRLEAGQTRGGAWPVAWFGRGRADEQLPASQCGDFLETSPVHSLGTLGLIHSEYQARPNQLDRAARSLNAPAN